MTVRIKTTRHTGPISRPARLERCGTILFFVARFTIDDGLDGIFFVIQDDHLIIDEVSVPGLQCIERKPGRNMNKAGRFRGWVGMDGDQVSSSVTFPDTLNGGLNKG